MFTYHDPVDKRRRFNVYKTSIQLRRRRIVVLQTFKRRRTTTGPTAALLFKCSIQFGFYMLDSLGFFMSYHPMAVFYRENLFSSMFLKVVFTFRLVNAGKIQKRPQITQVTAGI